ncbi:30S ribosomal protein S6 [Candidatus Parcubacteria bacterium]|jgi:ribosomal protein S6|nr:30S ribosomal protein S6 [Candidatus Parcubacteria bacterium]
MTNYELTYLISPETSEEQRETISQNITSFIKEQEGVLGNIQGKLIKKFLGYPIKDQNMAYVGTLYFSFLAEKVKNLEEKIKLEKQILRFMLITKPQKEKLNFRKRRKKFIPGIKKQKIELKEIDKKIEEILK